MGCYPNENKQIQCQGGAVVPGEGGKGPPCSTQCTSSQNGLLPLPVPWGHTEALKPHISTYTYTDTDIDLDILLVKAPNISCKPYICFNLILHSIKTWHGLKV